MPKHSIIFNLPEETNELKLAQRGGEYFAALFEIANELRKWRKYDKKPKDTLEAISELIASVPMDDIE